MQRRAALRIFAAGMALPLGVVALRRLAPDPEPVSWRGEALGALAGMMLWHPDPGHARATIAHMRAEVDRLEDIFSLYRPGSQIARLNRDGRLDAPARDLLDLLDESRRIADASRGAFDPTIQPLWDFHAGRGAASLAEALALVDYTALEAGPRGVRLGRAGMAISLNGIAQGYITDRVADLLSNEGYENAVIELGETRAVGAAPDGQPFRIGLMDPADPGTVNREVTLVNAALAVSGGYGARAGRERHIFDPKTGTSAERFTEAVVTAPRATTADGLSTALFAADAEAAPAILATCPGASALLTRADGAVITL